MDAVLDSPSFKPFEIRMVNYCRLYLRVTTLADITTAKGDAIDSGMYQGDPQSVIVNSRWYHVHQKRPSPKAWSCWRKACRLFANRRRELFALMGNWIVQPGTTRRHYQFRHDPSYHHPNWLYKQRPDGTYTKHAKLTVDFDQIPTAANVTLPERAVPVDVTPYYHGTWGITKTYRRFSVPPTPPAPANDSLMDIIQPLPSWEKPLLEKFEFLSGCNQQDLFDMIQTDTLYLCSAG